MRGSTRSRAGWRSISSDRPRSARSATYARGSPPTRAGRCASSPSCAATPRTGRCWRARTAYSYASRGRFRPVAENLTRQILDEHLVDGELKPGEPIGLRIDQTLLQDATGTMACMQFEQLGVSRVAVDRAVQYVDHNVIQLDNKNPDDHRMLQAMARKFGIDYSRPGNGICHYVHVERYAKPGGILVGADSHTTTSGAH